MFACVCLRDEAGTSDVDAGAHVRLLARTCSPRSAVVREGLVVMDASGMDRLFGEARLFAAHVAEQAEARRLAVSVAVAGTQTAAILIAGCRPGVSVVPPGLEAETLAPLPIGALAMLEPDAEAAVHGRRRVSSSARHYRMAPSPLENEPARHGGRAGSARSGPRPIAGSLQTTGGVLETLERWGVHTLGDLARLPAPDLFERLGEVGVRWRRLASGEDLEPLFAEGEEERFEEALVLEWPIEGLEPLSFVLARLLDPLCAHLDRRDRGAVVVHTWLKLVTRRVFHRAIELPAPMRDPKVLRTLILLDLESHPPDAGIDEVRLVVEPAPARQVQHSLLVRPLPPPDRVSTLTARLTALMGSGRVGSPHLVDTHRPGAFAVTPFVPDKGVGVDFSFCEPHGQKLKSTPTPVPVLRRFRRPAPVRVVVDRERRPVRVAASAAMPGGTVLECAGPWRTSGGWWTNGWDRDEWDVALADRAIYRVHRDRATGQWFVEGVWD